MELIIDIALILMGVAIGHFFPTLWDTMTSWFKKAPPTP